MVSKGKYAFSVEHEIDYIEDCSKICNVGYFEENEFVKFYAVDSKQRCGMHTE